MGRYSGKTCRLLTMIGLTASFFLVEIVVGYVTNSLALVGDSFHMLSDVVALIVGFASVRISKWHTKKNTFGWARAEVLGALVNTVFLIALCFSIFVEAIKRLIVTEPIEDPVLMMIVGGVGLVINVIGLFLFSGHGHSHGGGGHGHSHGGHGHSHGGGGHSHNHKKEDDHQEDDVPSIYVTSVHNNHSAAGAESNPEQQQLCNGSSKPQHTHNTKSDDDEEEEEYGNDTKAAVASSAQLNMRGVFLHVLGDALGSVIVIISALVIYFVKEDWRYKLDPCLSIMMVIIILSTTIPLLRESSLILLQTVPTHIQVREIQDKLIKKVKGVLAIHEFHVWQLAGNRIIASAHIRCQNLHEYMRIAEAVKNFFHNEGIHSTTIQPEFAESISADDHHHCLLDCTDQCQEHLCCRKDIRKRNARFHDDVGVPFATSNAALYTQIRTQISRVFGKKDTEKDVPSSKNLLDKDKDVEDSNV